MAAKQEGEVVTTVKKKQYSKEALLKSNKFAHRRDCISVVLKDGVKYSIDEVEKAIDKFMKGGA